MEEGSEARGFREPRQERSRRTLARIAEATESLLRERGPEGVTVQEVVARADASVGAFYTRFRGKDDAVAYVRRAFWDEAREMWTVFLDPDRWRGVPAAPLIAEVVRRFARHLLRPGGRSRAFLLELLTDADEAALRRARALDREIATLMGRLLMERSAEIGHPRPREAAEEGFLVVIGALRDRALIGAEAASGGDAGRHPGRRDAPTGGPERSPAEASALILRAAQMYSCLLGVKDPPTSYGRLLRMCAGVRQP